MLKENNFVQQSRLVLLSLVNFINIYKKNCVCLTIPQFYREIEQNTEFLQRYFDKNSVKTDPVRDPAYTLTV